MQEGIRRNEPRVPKKLLVASLGVAAVSYVACGNSDKSSKFPEEDAATDAAQDGPVVGNLMPPDARIQDAPVDQLVANLVAPPEYASIKE